MFDVSDDAKGGFRRVEVLTGPARRRRWSADQKARIVAETLEPGARVAEVARRWQLCSQQVFGWRRAARRDVPAAVREDNRFRGLALFRLSPILFRLRRFHMRGGGT